MIYAVAYNLAAAHNLAEAHDLAAGHDWDCRISDTPTIPGWGLEISARRNHIFSESISKILFQLSVFYRIYGNFFKIVLIFLKNNGQNAGIFRI